MVKKSIKRRPKSSPMLIGQNIYALLEAMGGNADRCKLVRLWEKWTEVVGIDIAEQVEVIGHKGSMLFLGVEDSIQLQELSFQREEILLKINTFLQNQYFTDIRFQLSKKN